MRFLPLIWSNLRRKKARTLLALLSIVLAFVLYGYLAAISRALDQGVSVAGTDRLMVRHRVSIAQPLPESYKGRITRIPDVAAVTYLSWFGGIWQDPKNFFAQMAVEPEPFLEVYPEYLLAPEQREAFLKTRTAGILPAAQAMRLRIAGALRR